MILHARIRGGGLCVPLRFARGGVLYGCLMGMRGGPKMVLSYSYHFFQARFARQQYI